MSLVAAPRRPHDPVMLDRVVGLLESAPPGPVVDCTLGAGGHAAEVMVARAARHGSATLIGIDRDPDALDLAERRLADAPGTAHLVHARADELARVLADLDIDRVAGVLYDLGVSSMHLDRPERGFSFRHDGPLDMRMDPTRGRTAADLVNDEDEATLGRMIARLGEERYARRIARAIVRHRPFTTTGGLADVIRSAIPGGGQRLDPATRTFQALRIAVNDELEGFADSLEVAMDVLTDGGIIVVLAYHSLEDRIAKRSFATAVGGCICPPDLPVCGCGREPTVEHVTKGVERPDADEVERNPRARSARLRAVRRLPRDGTSSVVTS